MCADLGSIIALCKKISSFCGVKNSSKLELSRGEICVANIISPAYGASQGDYQFPKVNFSLKQILTEF